MAPAEDSATMTDPFLDPGEIMVTERDIVSEATIAVGKDATLTLAQDQIIILDEEVQEHSRLRCFSFAPKTIATTTIPYYNVLSVELSKLHIVITYAEPTSKRNPTKSSVRVSELKYPLNSERKTVERWVERLLDRAYGPSQRQKRIKVLINPFGGVGRAQKVYHAEAAPIFAAAGCMVDVETTTHRGHAREIAERLDITSYDVLCCASGDGLPMEAFNGLGLKPNAAEALRKVAVVQLPCGSGNAMSWNLNGTANVSLAALAIVKGVRTPLDLASVTQPSTGNQRTLSFLSQSIGIIAESDLGTDNIRWMGDLRFTVGFLVRLLGKTVYPIDIAVRTEIENKDDIKRHYASEISKRNRIDMGSHDILDKELETSTALGLPPLMYGTASDPLPSHDGSDPLHTAGWSPMETYANMGNFYCGNMCYMAADTQFFTASLPNDGLLDLVTIDGDISRLRALGLMLDVSAGRLLDQEIVRYRKVTAVRIIPRFGWAGAKPIDATSTPSSSPSSLEQQKHHHDHQPPKNKKPGLLARLLARLAGSPDESFFSIDGENTPFEPFQIEVHRGLGTVLSKRWGRYEYDQGPAGWEQFSEDQVIQPTTTITSSNAV